MYSIIPIRYGYPRQKIYVVEALDYVYLVPFIHNENDIFLKTIIPSRKAKNVTKGTAMFDDEEMSILTALENNLLMRSINADEEIALAKQAAKEYLSKSKNVTIRLSLGDVTLIKNRAQDVGIPYQTLISSLVHQYATGKIHLET